MTISACWQLSDMGLSGQSYLSLEVRLDWARESQVRLGRSKNKILSKGNGKPLCYFWLDKGRDVSMHPSGFEFDASTSVSQKSPFKA